MRAQSINLSVICSIPPPPPASPQDASNRREGKSARQSITQKQNPAGAGSCRSARRTAGNRGGSGPIQARLLVVSRAFFAKVQRSLAGLRSYPQEAWFTPAC